MMLKKPIPRACVTPARHRAARGGNGWRLLVDLFGDFVSQLFDFALLEGYTLLFEESYDFVTCSFTSFRSEKETNCSTCYGTANDSEYNL